MGARTYFVLAAPGWFGLVAIIVWLVTGSPPDGLWWAAWVLSGWLYAVAGCSFVLHWRAKRSRPCPLCQVLVYRSPGAHLRHLARAHQGQEIEYLGAWADAIEARAVTDWTEDLR